MSNQFKLNQQSAHLKVKSPRPQSTWNKPLGNQCPLNCRRRNFKLN